MKKKVEESADRTVTGQRPDSDQRDLILGSTKTRPDSGNANRTAASKRLPKDHRDYWLSKLKKRTYTNADGQRLEIPEYQVRMFCNGQERWFNCKSANREVAAAKAKEIYLHIIKEGWEATVAKYSPTAPKRTATTLGDYLEAVKHNTSLSAATLGIYTRKTRTLLAGLFGLHGDKSKNYHGNDQWSRRIDSIRLDRMKAERVDKWKSKKLREAEKGGPLEVKEAKSTINSIIRNAKALFSPYLATETKLDMPTPLPLAGVTLFPVNVKAYRYRSKIDPQALFVAARNELAEPEPEQFKIILLALFAGLRRGEIDGLEWSNVDYDRGIIRVEVTEHSDLKSDDSEGAVDIDPAVLKLLKAYKQPGCGPFVVRGDYQMRKDLTANYSYRCGKHFAGLNKWLRSKGVNTHSPIHTLRKEYGSLIAQSAGIFAASLALRHSDIRMTRNVYAGKKSKVFLPIESLTKLETPTQNRKETA